MTHSAVRCSVTRRVGLLRLLSLGSDYMSAESLYRAIAMPPSLQYVTRGRGLAATAGTSVGDPYVL
jgi:hypothetical protein